MSQTVIDLTDVLASVGPAGIVVLGALAAFWTARSKAGRRWARKLIRKLFRWLRTALWGQRLGISPTLAGRLRTERWNNMVSARRLQGLSRGKVTRTPVGVSVALGLGAPLTIGVVSAGIDQLETGLGLPSGACRIKPAARRSDRAFLNIVLRDPLKDGVPWQPPRGPVRLKDPVFLAMTPYGDKITLDMRQRIGIFGTSGSGKSCVQRVMGAHVIQSDDADLEIWDLKFGTESQHYEGKAHRVTTPEEAVERTNWLIDVEFPRRAERMKARKTSSWKETRTDPALVVFIDEGNVVVRSFTPPQLKRFFQAVEQGRALGVYFVWATQFPKSTNLPTELRSQLNVRVCLRVMNAEESRVVYKDDVKAGWTPHLLSDHWMLIQSGKHRSPDEARNVFLSEEDFADVPLSGSVPDGTRTDTKKVSLSKDSPVVLSDLADAVVSVQLDDVPDIRPVSVQDTILSVLTESDTPLGQRDIARTLDKDQAHIGRTLKKMLSAGSVVQNEDRKYLVS